MKRLAALALLLIGCASNPASSIPTGNTDTIPTAPKLVVGIVIDQMRYDYLTRYYDDFCEGGFKRLMGEGFMSHDHHFSYAPTFTGPGHASIYTGTSPAVHGIIANDWYDRKLGKVMYCASDSTSIPVGTEQAAAKMSAYRMLSSTLCEELELATQGESKTIGIALKDRSSLLPVGSGGDAAYWYMGGTEGNWISCEDYMSELPSWVQKFNGEGHSAELLKQDWELLLDPKEYNESHADNNPYEGKMVGKVSPTFPYDLEALAPANGNFSILKGVPHGNTITIEFAKAAIEAEQMGADDITDLLALSFSATDYVGHRFGVDAMETQDIYLRLDREIEAFLNYLDEKIGLENVSLFVTGDHGSPHVPSYLEHQKMNGGYWQPGNMVEDVKAMLNTRYGQGEWVLNYSNDQFFLNHDLIWDSKIDIADMQSDIAAYCLKIEGVHTTITASSLMMSEFNNGIHHVIQSGYMAKRSGDVMVVTNPGWITYGRTGTTHGSPFAYDTHVPLILFGNGIAPADHYKRTYIKDIAPTVAAIMGIQMPNGSTGRVIHQAIER
ncbi:MAG: putative AlkP superfamily pyrophosphatase or phosphodiesterase [Litorivivens sp.]|jgi:predicted AlkP superfamily pyrophosphatase or phosphodiesterase